MASFRQVDRIGEAAAGIHIEFAVRITKMCDALHRTRAGNHFAGQLLRSGTSPTRGAESSRDFVHKLKICLKELNESRVWLKIITRSELLAEDRLAAFIQESDELGRIVNASINTVRANREL